MTTRAQHMVAMALTEAGEVRSPKFSDDVLTAKHRVIVAAIALRGREPVLHVEIAPRKARVIPFHSFQSRRYVSDLVSMMLKVDWGGGEVTLSREKQAIWETLVGAGADASAVDRALRSLETAFRVELWHRVLGSHGT